MYLSDRLHALMNSTSTLLFIKISSIIAIAICIISRLVAADTQIDWDEELYFQVAREWSDGLIPYRDIFDHKSPAVYFFYLITSVFGSYFIGVRVFVCVLLIVASVMMVKAMHTRRILIGNYTYLYAALLVSLFSQRLSIGTNTELIYGPFIMMSLAGLLSRRIFSASLAGSAAVLIKYTSVLDLAGVAIFFVAADGFKKAEILVIAKWGVLVTFLSGIIFALFYIYFLQNEIDLINQMFLLNIKHGAGERLPLFSDNILTRAICLYVLYISIALVLSDLERSQIYLSLAAAIWLGLSFIQAGLTGKYYDHYLFPAVIPFVAFLASMRFENKRYAAAAVLVLSMALASLLSSITLYRSYERTKLRYAANCGAIVDRGYIATGFLAGYRVCGARVVDKFMFPPFYIDRHFADLADSGGLPGLLDKLGSGKLQKVILEGPPRQYIDISYINTSFPPSVAVYIE